MLSRATLQSRPSARQLLARVLGTPQLAEQIQALPAPVLGQLIDHVGLEDAAELVAFAKTEQLAEIFDRDLWQSHAPGEDERFDAGRFVLWLEIMLEAGERFVAERLAELPADLLTLALHRHVLVVTLADLERELGAADDAGFAAEKAFESCASEELDDYQLIWRGGDGWDAVVGALLALDRDHHAVLVGLLERCAALSSEQVEDSGGLHAVLSGEEMLESDLAGEREARRAADGFVAPSAALAFLRLARKPAAPVVLGERDALTRAYFRELGAGPRRPPPAPASRSAPRELAQLLSAAGLSSANAALAALGEPARRPRLGKSSSRGASLLGNAMARLAERDSAAFAQRSEELAYLTNAVLVGASVDGRRLRPVEAVEHVMSSVSLGLGLACSASGTARLRQATELLGQHGCDGLLRLAWSRALEPQLLKKAPGIDPVELRRVQALLGSLKI